MPHADTGGVHLVCLVLWLGLSMLFWVFSGFSGLGNVAADDAADEAYHYRLPGNCFLSRTSQVDRLELGRGAGGMMMTTSDAFFLVVRSLLLSKVLGNKPEPYSTKPLNPSTLNPRACGLLARLWVFAAPFEVASFAREAAHSILKSFRQGVGV